jgi:exodeoxyribonuclease-3|tara:strand:- start:390 stop:1202 length:813 start_codon:yes stop_codon:yes gene_type:complete
LRFVSFNANGIRARLHQIEAIETSHAPEIIAIQECKVADESFPMDDVRALGFPHVHIYGQKGHYGVALLSKRAPIHVQHGIPWRDDEQQRRFIAADYELNGQNLRVINGYFPQGESRDHPTKFPAKEQFYADVTRYLTDHCDPGQAVIVAGDMNVAPEDADIGIGADNNKRWLRAGKASFLPEERQWLSALFGWGLDDTYARAADGDRLMSWFDYRSRGFERTPKRGLRIDLILASKPLAARLRECGIDHDIRAQEKPSDHCPIWIEFDT